MTIIEIMRKFGTSQKCIELLEQVRWAGGVTCPYCFSKKISSKAEKGRASRHQCQNCKKSFTVLVGTIFHSAKKLPEWFMILSMMLDACKSRSSCEISRKIGMRQASV